MKNKKNQIEILKLQNVIFTVVISTILFCTQSKAQIITTIAGTGTMGYGGDGGQATDANINMFLGLDVDKYGIIYISDYGNNRIRKMSSTGIISTIAGTGVFGFSGDHGPATDAQIYKPFGIAKDRHGNIFISDTYNNRIRKVDSFGTITTFAGNGTYGFGGDGGPATDASFEWQGNITVDTIGNVYIADWGNNRVRKVTTDGIINTIVGSGHLGYDGDGGPATDASLAHPCDIVFDKLGNMYIVESLNCVVRKVTTSGIISTYAGIATSGSGGDGGLATDAHLSNPSGIALDSHNNLYIADAYNDKIRKVDSSGIITTFAGNGVFGYGGDGGQATDASFSHPGGIRVDINDNVYIADAENYRLRYIGRNRLPIFVNGALDSLSICSDSVPHPINSLLSVRDSDYYQTLTWSVIALPLHGSLTATYSTYSTGTTVVPIGLSYTPTYGYSGSDSFRVRVSDGNSSDTIKIIVRIGTGTIANTIVGIDSICISDVTTYTDSISGGIWVVSNGNATISTTGVLTTISPGLDTISYTFLSTCGTSISYKVIHILSLPYASAIICAPYLCEGDTILLYDSTIGGVWTHTSSSSILSGNNLIGISHGRDTIQYHVYNYCGTATVSKIIHIYTIAECDSIVTVANEKYINTNAFTIYPNPVNQVLTILNNDNNTKCSATILNEVGQIVLEKNFSENEVQLNLDKLATGIYFIRLQNRNRVFYDKIIKQ